jgi:molecular chaperone DnaJ
VAAESPDREEGRSEADLYQALGVHPTATLEQIKAAFRRQALRYHPDKNAGSSEASERFKQVNEAYATLSDPDRRALYDSAHDGRGVPAIARELIEDVLLGRRRVRRRAGRDLRYTLELPYREAALGVERTIRFPVAEPCASCGGVGAAVDGTRPCPSCGGKGEARDPRSILPLPRRCPRCGGQGISIAEPCTTCSGVGSVERIREYKVKLQAGVRSGEIKRVSGEGEPGVGGAASGDLLVVVRVRPDSLLREEGDQDLTLTAPISLALAVRGGQIEVPALEGGTLKMRIPPGTQSGRVFRLRGQGRPRARGGDSAEERGSLLVRVEVETPAELAAEARRRLEAFEASCSPAAYPRQREYQALLAEKEPAS